MKIRVNEKQFKLLKTLKENAEGKTYVANFEVLLTAVNDEQAIAQLDAMKQQIINATKNAEVHPSLFEKTPFGTEPKKIV